MVHRSHISAGEAKAKGWSRIPPPSVRAETLNLNKEVGTSYMAGEYMNLSACNTSDIYSTTATATIGYAPSQTWGGLWDTSDNITYTPPIYGTYIPPITQIQTILQEKEVTKEVEKRTLFEVFVVDPRKNGKVLLDGIRVIAINENQAMLKAGVGEVATKANLELEQVDVYVRAIGTFIRPKKEVQRVKQVTEEE